MGMSEDRITAEIEELQHKLGDLQANIDKVLREVVIKAQFLRIRRS